MCYYVRYDMPCGDWKWGNFHAHCSKEYRTGETCGMKLVWETVHMKESCKYCVKMEIKKGKICKEQDRIKRWKHEGNRRVSIEKSEQAINDMEREIWELNEQRASIKYRHNH